RDGPAERDPGPVATRFRGGQADRLQLPPDGRHVLDAYPVELDVLPVGDVGAVARVLLRHPGHGPELGQVELATVDAYPQHEVLVFELVRLEDRGTPAVNAGGTLGVESEPAEPGTQVGWIDAGKAPMRVDRLDSGADVERVVVLLAPLVGVEGLTVAQRPLPLAAHPPLGGGTGGDGGCRHAASSCKWGSVRAGHRTVLR